MEGHHKIQRQPRTGKLDLKINDSQFRHIVKSVVRETRPSHIAVLGDVFSNQWISNAEFAERLARFKWATGQDEDGFLPKDIPVFNLSGNHDIGYGRDTTRQMLDRWQAAFGAVNDRFTLTTDQHPHEVMLLNTQNLDTTNDETIRDETWHFLRKAVADRWATDFAHPLVLLMHIPLYKPEGVCVDPPVFNRDHNGVVIDQTVLSPWASQYILHCLRPTVILTGHDHEGCKVIHHVKRVATERIGPTGDSKDHPPSPTKPTDGGSPSNSAPEALTDEDREALRVWCHAPYRSLEADLPPIERRLEVSSRTFVGTPRALATTSQAQIRRYGGYRVPEITVRSVMGDYDGNSGLFEIALEPPLRRLESGGNGGDNDDDVDDASDMILRYYYRDCPFGHFVYFRGLLIADVVVAMLSAALVVIYLTLPGLWQSLVEPTVDFKKRS
ncbi:hypothetical protein IWQ60_001873 [Tieghemiomyces parasiticus]|uniref:Calcineurin-like phosphoesterase domain-containing protein n=1 Tax=Tieghemiomyces parasiticus TaxID=78921 RepID=A0A9W8E1I1_9FUNG|nr:hypothetical protein IWQ60_001873 [Tieghemiomyces parasiticus]